MEILIGRVTLEASHRSEKYRAFAEEARSRSLYEPLAASVVAHNVILRFLGVPRVSESLGEVTG